MTTLDWMTKQYSKPGDVKYFGSIMRDNRGNLYSYGSHYPLLFKAGDLNIVNTASYSVSTTRHSSWAMSVVGYSNYVGIDLPRDFRLYTWQSDDKLLKELHVALIQQRQAKQAEMDAKKRKDTNVYRWLEYGMSKIELALQKVEQELQAVHA